MWTEFFSSQSSAECNVDTNKVFVKMKPLFSQKNSIPVSKCYTKTPKTLQENRSNEKEVKDFKKAFHIGYINVCQKPVGKMLWPQDTDEDTKACIN